ncbi:MAG: Rpn family recombination-promoting nuclease/putative transposase [Treponema sp.]|nr:Rpn family recombination-promoting nuclease/putative transposase [Treponema sp.]
MVDKDITEKNLEALNDVFADIVNVLLFDGRPVIHEDELEPASEHSIFKADGKIHEQERDVSKFWKNGEIRISLLGLENQTKKDNNMPLRVISYDGAAYKQQLLDRAIKKKYPVITLVLYFGMRCWNKPKSLFDCFDVPEELKPFINDYKINVFEIAWLDEETISKFKSDFKIVAEFFHAKRINEEIKGSKEIIKHVDETLKLMSSLTGDDSFERVYNELNEKKKGGTNMDELLQRYVNKGKTQKAEDATIKLLKEGITPEVIAKCVDLPIERVLELQESILVKA